MADDIEERIRQRAYAIWEREGRPEGREHEHWLKAVEEIRAETGMEETAMPSAAPSDIGMPEPGTSAGTGMLETGTSETEPAQPVPPPKTSRSRKAGGKAGKEDTNLSAAAEGMRETAAEPAEEEAPKRATRTRRKSATS